MAGDPTSAPPPRVDIAPFYFGTRITGVGQNRSGVVLIGIENLAIQPFDGELSGLFFGGCFYMVENDSDETKWLWSCSCSRDQGYVVGSTELPPGGVVTCTKTSQGPRWYTHIITLLDFNPGLTGGPLPDTPPLPYYYLDIETSVT
jgi:hypothetical protein